jgi:hypothetical protein
MFLELTLPAPIFSVFRFFRQGNPYEPMVILRALVRQWAQIMGTTRQASLIFRRANEKAQ